MTLDLNTPITLALLGGLLLLKVHFNYKTDILLKEVKFMIEYLKAFEEYFRYEDGKLIWIKRRPRVTVGNEVGTVNPKHGYRTTRFLGINMSVHRIIWIMHHKRDIVGEIDHINQNRSDNRIENLREVTNKENMKNQTKYTNNKSGVTGVERKKNRWVASIRVDGKLLFLGSFIEKDDAIEVRKAAELEHRFHGNHGRNKT